VDRVWRHTEKHGVDLLLGRRATRLDPARQVVVDDRGDDVPAQRTTGPTGFSHCVDEALVAARQAHNAARLAPQVEGARRRWRPAAVPLELSLNLFRHQAGAVRPRARELLMGSACRIADTA
jgi:hypothetical protein